MTHPTENRAGLSRRRLLEVLAAAPLVLSGCSSLVPGQGPPPNLYRLTPKPEIPDALPKVDWQLEVAVPNAPASLDSTRVALLHDPSQFEYYARANWVDRVPLLIQSMLIEFFESSGKILSVGRDSSDVHPDYVLNTELRDFQMEYFPGPLPSAHVGINARLISVRQRSIIASRRFDELAPASADRIDAIVAAFNISLGKALDAIIAWTIENGEADRKSG
ncbi:MAG: ABC-type transport auxiliary lipoprotein family protein [Alphaproteobacteria bacterium]